MLRGASASAVAASEPLEFEESPGLESKGPEQLSLSFSLYLRPPRGLPGALSFFSPLSQPRPEAGREWKAGGSIT